MGSAAGRAPAGSGQSTHGLFSPPIFSTRQSRGGSSESIEKDKDAVQVEKEKKEQNPASSYEMTK